MNHAQLEEQGVEDGEEMVREAIEEPQMTELIMDRFQKTETDDQTFEAKFKVPMESTKHHFMEEERELFPKANKALQGDPDRLGKEMTALEKQLMKK